MMGFPFVSFLNVGKTTSDGDKALLSKQTLLIQNKIAFTYTYLTHTSKVINITFVVVILTRIHLINF